MDEARHTQKKVETKKIPFQFDVDRKRFGILINDRFRHIFDSQEGSVSVA